jgi:hypothetical protein
VSNLLPVGCSCGLLKEPDGTDDDCRMLAVMSFNIGYYFSVLLGVFLGELAVGRFNSAGGDHH